MATFISSDLIEGLAKAYQERQKNPRHLEMQRLIKEVGSQAGACSSPKSMMGNPVSIGGGTTAPTAASIVIDTRPETD